MAHNFKAMLAAACLLGLPACQSTTIPPTALALNASALQERQQQSRRFGTTDEEKILRACAQVLQDLGFQIDESETKLGLIVASKARSAIEAQQVAAAVVVALLAKGASLPFDTNQKIRASVVVRKVDKGTDTVVRVTIQRIVWNNHNGVSKTEEINDPEIYRQFFEKLGQSVFLTAQDI